MPTLPKHPTLDNVIGAAHELRLLLWRRQARHNEQNTIAHLAMLAEIESLKRKCAELEAQIKRAAWNEYDALKIIDDEQN
jgi:hypothetical protein